MRFGDQKSMMKRTLPYLLFLTISLPLAGCFSSQTPQTTDQAAKQFSGGPMPPDAQKKFQDSMKKNQEPTRQNGQAGGKR